MAMKKAPKKKETANNGMKRSVSYILVVVLLAVACYTVFHYIRCKKELDEQKQNYATLLSQYEEQSKQNETLASILDEGNIDGFIREKARDDGYGMPGERVYRDASAD